MSSTKLSTKGQVVIPKGMRDRLGWSDGATLDVQDIEGCVVLRLAGGIPATSVDDLVGCANYDGPRKTLQEMEQAIAAGAGERP